MTARSLVVVVFLVACRRDAPAPVEASPSAPGVTAPDVEAAPAQQAPFVIASDKPFAPLQIEGDTVVAQHLQSLTRFAIAPSGARAELHYPGVTQGSALGLGDSPVVEGDQIFSISWDASGTFGPRIAVQQGSTSKILATFEGSGLDLAVDADAVYVTELGAVSRILSVPKSGGALRTIVRTHRSFGDFELGATHVYWREGGVGHDEVFRMAKLRGKAEKLFDVAPGEGRLHVAGTDVFYLQSDGIHRFTDGALVLVPNTSDAEELVYDGEDLVFLTKSAVRTPTRVLATTDGTPSRLRATRRYVVWATEKGLYGLRR